MAGNLAALQLCFFWEKDPSIPLAPVQAIDDALRTLGKTCEVRVYPHTDHGFFCDDSASDHPEAANSNCTFQDKPSDPLTSVFMRFPWV